MNEQPNSKTRQAIAALAVLIVIVAIVTAASLANKKKNSSMVSASSSTLSTGANTPTNTSTANASNSTTNTGLSTASFKDGNYTATSSFDTPGGTDDITVSVTLKNNVVTAVSAQENATDHDSRAYDQMFNGGIESAVVGKKIDELALSRVAGASLTTEGFNGAIAQIERQAQNG